MKMISIQIFTLIIVMLSINQSNALIYDYRYQGNVLTTVHNRNNSLPVYTVWDAISFDLQLSQALPVDPTTFDPATLLLLTAWDGTQLISTANGASYSISLTTDPTTGLPSLGGFWRVSTWQTVQGGTHTITTSGNGWAGSFGGEGFDEAYYSITDIFSGNSAWNNTNPGTWSLTILPDNPVPTPEPCTFLLFGAGLGGMFYLRKRVKS